MFVNFFDLHCDTPYECFKRKINFSDESLAVTFKKGNIFKNWYQCFAVWVKDDMPNPFNYYKSVIEDFKNKLADKPHNLTPILTVEGGALIEKDLSRIHVLKNDGIKALTLTWNGENTIASGAFAQGGLKDFGKDVIIALNESRIATDLSHLNRQSFFEAIEYAKFPIATHSCCDFINHHNRNLTDSQIKLIAQNGGVIGICFYPAFLGDGDVFENIYKHICHLLELGCENHIAIGSDFDGAQMDNKLIDTSKVPELYYKLLEFGIDKHLLEKIFYKNAYNFFNKL